MTTWATKRLDELVGGAEPPPVVLTMRLGTRDAWGEGWVKKRWEPTPETLNADGSLFGGLIAALADQVLAFAAMTGVPASASTTHNPTASSPPCPFSESARTESRMPCLIAC